MTQRTGHRFLRIILVLTALGDVHCTNETEVAVLPIGQYQPADAGADSDGTVPPDVVEQQDQAPVDTGGADQLDMARDDGQATDVPEVPDATDGPGEDGDDGGGVPASCGFDYDETFASRKSAAPGSAPGATGPAPRAGTARVGGDRRNFAAVRQMLEREGPEGIATVEPPPPFTFQIPARASKAADDITMPGYQDDMPLFERAMPFQGEIRCFEIPGGADLLSEAEAYDLYRRIAEETTGLHLDTSPQVRSVIGLRGAYPGTFQWHGNTPDRFNDTLVLLWIDEDGQKRVLEFPVHTDVGAYDFGTNASSSLRPNRRYRYLNGWHRSYNALSINEWDYRVRNDTNHNGHWDSDRNGWLPPYTGDDYDRTGNGHNIHMASVDGPLGQALVRNWSAGCQVIPGMANWTEFITNAWTDLGDPVDYYLIDVRDIPPAVWSPCTPDGSHECPWHIPAFPFTHDSDTSASPVDQFDFYNCSEADESGPEVVYLFTLDRSGTLQGSVDCDDPIVDVDIHLLDGDDPNACLARGHWSLSHAITPGRYFIVVDTYVDDSGPYDGSYTLDLLLD